MKVTLIVYGLIFGYRNRGIDKDNLHKYYLETGRLNVANYLKIFITVLKRKCSRK